MGFLGWLFYIVGWFPEQLATGCGSEFYFFFLVNLFIFWLFRAALVAYGSSQAGVGVKLELQLPAYTTAGNAAMQDPSDLHHSSWQHQMLNPH